MVTTAQKHNDSLFHELMDDVKEISKSSTYCSNKMKLYLKKELKRLRSENIQHVKGNFQPNKIQYINANVCEQEDQELHTTFCSPFPHTNRRNMMSASKGIQKKDTKSV